MDLRGIQALVFDMGGTLYDTPRETTIMTRFVLKKLGLRRYGEYSDKELEDVIDSVDKLFDNRLVESNADPHWLPSYDVSVEYGRLILEKLGVQGDLGAMASFSHGEWIKALPRTRPKFLEPCRSTLESLRSRGYHIAIASNRRNDPVPRLESDGVLHLFDAIEYSCVPGYRKPSPYMLLRVASELRINPRRCAYVGDKVDYDVQAAVRAEFIPVLLVWCGPEETDRAPKDTPIIRHIEELLDLLPSSPSS